jgi:sugar phosphate isomerase/epimerase
MNRREALNVMAGVATTALCNSSMPALAELSDGKTGLGLVVYCCALRRQMMKQEDATADLFEPLTFLAHCRKLGAGGAQMSLGIREPKDARAIRQQAERDGLYVEAIISVPKDKADVERFDAEVQTAAQAGALAIRTTIIPGRRYEFFDSLAMFREYEARGRRSLELATPIVEKHRVPLAVENHKDQRDDDRVELLKHISSPFVGACVDTGNSFALLEDPIATAEKFAPWAHSVHLKDQAVQLYDDGFLLGDIPLGQGLLDLKKMVEILRRQKPDIRFSLELITRDPLKVPCLTDKYWATFPNVPGSDLARTLRMVRDGATNNLQQVSSLPPDQQVALEDANVRASLNYAREHLGLWAAIPFGLRRTDFNFAGSRLFF